MTPVKPQISKLRPRDLAKWALTCYGGSTHERLLIQYKIRLQSDTSGRLQKEVSRVLVYKQSVKSKMRTM